MAQDLCECLMESRIKVNGKTDFFTVLAPINGQITPFTKATLMKDSKTEKGSIKREMDNCLRVLGKEESEMEKAS